MGWWLAPLLGLALALRVWGVGFGLPYLYHPDEPAHVLQALAVGQGLPNGLTFANPPLYKYLLLGVYGLTYAVGHVLGVFASPRQLLEQFRADPSLVYLLARVTSASLGALTLVPVAWLGREVVRDRCRAMPGQPHPASDRADRASAWWGLVAAALAGGCYLLVRESHFGTNDALVTLAVTSGLVWCVRIARGGTWRDDALAGASLGLAFSAKYQGAALVVPLVLAHALQSNGKRFQHLAIAGLAATAAAVLTFPSLVTEAPRVLHDIDVHLYQPARAGYDGMDPAGGYVFYLKTLALGLGWPLLAASCLGLAVAARERSRALVVVASLPVVLLAALGLSHMYFARFALPAVPALIVLGAAGLERLARTLPTRSAVAMGVLALTAVAGLATLADSVRLDVLLTRDDTRTLARTWIQRQLPASASLVVDAPPLGPPLQGVSHMRVLEANEFSIFDLSPADYSQRDVEYVVASSFTSELPMLDPDADARRRDFYAALARQADVVAEFRPYFGDEPGFAYDRIYGPFDALHRFERPGPTITVYRISAAVGRSP